MIQEDKVLVVDIDGTLCEIRKSHQDYIDVEPKIGMINKLRKYANEGFYIILSTSRQMKTYKGNLGKINANTAKTLFEWLEKYNVPYDEIYFGKPWCGRGGFYIDDKAIRPSEFENLDYDEILELIKG